jgi:hypothetical protein
MTAERVTKLFVPVAEELELGGPEHVFLHGHRGCGKSMMLRLMAPDCQIIEVKKKLRELPYLGIYTTVKATGLDVTEYERLNNQYAGLVLAEHSLVSFLGAKAFKSLQNHCAHAIEEAEGRDEMRKFVENSVLARLQRAGADISSWVARVQTAETVAQILNAVSNALDESYGYCSDYLKRSSFQSGYQPYQGILLGYREFLFPILSELNQMSFMPRNKPVYFLLDDADNLNSLQTQVLNTWVSLRTGSSVAFKISTQLAYKTLLTASKQRIETPHDFREIHVSSIHTGASSSSRYPQWVSEVVKKRLRDNDIVVEAVDFFPEDAEQEERIRKFGEIHREQWKVKPRGYRPGDDAYRYARADYIKSLGGISKQQSTYRYAGFQQLVHISSGIVRYFLDNAAEMYAKQQIAQQAARNQNVGVLRITPAIQDEVVRDAADQLMFGTLDKLEEEATANDSADDANEFKQLRNLIRALGGIFQEILLSDRSERRVFSIALTDDPPEKIMHILRLGVRHGYFYEAAIGTKEGNWRTRRYVMTRRLAPTFKLDPMGFSGYLFVTSELLHEAIMDPRRAVISFKENRLGSVANESQLPLGF